MWVRSLLLAAIVLAAGASPALADKGGRHRGDWQSEQGFDQRGRGDHNGNNNDDQRPRGVRPVREVADELCQLSRGGEVLSIRPLEEGSRSVYVLRCRMPNGEVRDFHVDASR